MTPYYSSALVDLYLGDNLRVLAEIEERGVEVDLVVTSPPYNLGSSPWPALSGWTPSHGRGSSKWDASGGDIDYDNHDDAMPWSEYVRWQHETWRRLWSVLSPRGAIFWNHKPRVIGGRLWKPDELIPDELRDHLRQEVIWARSGGVNYNETAYVSTHERIYVVAREGWRLRSKASSGVGDVWRIHQRPSKHPAPFPLELPARAIETTDPRLVLDPYAGSGTTLLAASKAGVCSIGIEKSAVYCQMARERLGGRVAFGTDSLFAEESS